MSVDIVAHLESVLEPAALRNGFELVAVELAGGQGSPILRVYLDREGGIDLDAICAANEWVSAVLDQEDPFSGAYTLEVSSPGVDRPLRTADDYARFTGSAATLKTRSIEGRTRFTGTITGFGDDIVTLDMDGTSIDIPLADIRSARLKGDVDFGRGKDGGTR